MSYPKTTKRKEGHQRLFAGYKFYFYGSFAMPAPPKSQLEEVVQIGHAEILSSPPSLPNSLDELLNSRTVVIVDPQCSPDLIKEIFIQTGRYPISFFWILDCISHYTLLDISKYKILVDDSDLCETQDSLAF